MFRPTLDRRHLFAAAGGLATLASAAGALTACSSTSQSGNTTQVNQGVKLPTCKAYAGLNPDLPGTELGVLPAFRSIPKDRPKTVADKPGAGEPVSGMANIYDAVPPGPTPMVGRPQRAGGG